MEEKVQEEEVAKSQTEGHPATRGTARTHAVKELDPPSERTQGHQNQEEAPETPAPPTTAGDRVSDDLPPIQDFSLELDSSETLKKGEKNEGDRTMASTRTVGESLDPPESLDFSLAAGPSVDVRIEESARKEKKEAGKE